MAKNAVIIDYKPKNEVIVDYKPKNEIIFSETNQLYDMTLGQNQWLGFSAITYPTAIDIVSPKSS